MERSGTIAANELVMHSVVQELLYFDRIYTTDNGFYEMQSLQRSRGRPDCPFSDSDPMWARFVVVGRILDAGILRVLPHSRVEALTSDKERLEASRALRKLESGTQSPNDVRAILTLDVQHRRRIATFVNSRNQGSEELAIPFILSNGGLEREFGVLPGGTPCLQVILNSLPAVDESVPIEEVLSFRKDSESVRLRGALMTWQNQTEREQLTAHETADLIATRSEEYRSYMELSGLRVTRRKAGLVVRLGAALVESIAKMSLDPILKRLLEFSQLNLDLREAELSAPGREVAYLSYAARIFDKKYR